jgi:hypothetical protein
MNNLEQMPPLKPQLTLRVGITGHRHASKDGDQFRYPESEKSSVGQQIKETLNYLKVILNDIHVKSHFFYEESPPRLRFFSALAEGADQEAAEIALQLSQNTDGVKDKDFSCTLECILPFSKEEYSKDFTEPETLAKFHNLLSNESTLAVFELDGHVHDENRSKAYEAAGVLMLENIDILIAVWDGNKLCPRGGTCDIVEKAQIRGIPIVWIQTSPDSSLQFWCHEYGFAKGFVSITEESINNYSKLKDVIVGLIAPPEEKETNEQLKTFFERKSPKGYIVKSLYNYFGKFYKNFRNWAVKNKCPDVPKISNHSENGDWDCFLGQCLEVGHLKDQILNRLQLGYRIIDAEAVFCADQYRSSYVAMFLLASIAVAVGLGAIFSSELLVKGICTAIELAIIVSITQILRNGKKNFWHQRFLDARIIAEHLRHARFLALVGLSGGGIRPSTTGKSSSEQMVEWYIRAMLRELVVPNTCVDDTTNYLKKIKERMVMCELNDQINYNKKNHAVLKELDHWLHKKGEWLFFATAWICSIYLFLLFFYWLHNYLPVISGKHFGCYETFLKVLKTPFTFFAATCPSFAAALTGIRYQGDFKAFSERSYATQKRLEEIRDILENQTRVINLSTTGERFKTCAEIMAHDVGAWRMIYNNRPLEAPG